MHIQNTRIIQTTRGRSAVAFRGREETSSCCNDASSSSISTDLEPAANLSPAAGLSLNGVFGRDFASRKGFHTCMVRSRVFFFFY